MEQPQLALAKNQRVIRDMQKEADQIRQNLTARPFDHDWNEKRLSAIETFLEDMHATSSRLRQLIEASGLDDSVMRSIGRGGRKPASFLGLPREVRERIYSLAMPWGNIHIQYHRNSYSFSSYSPPSYEQGSGFTRNLCLWEGTSEDDETETSKWNEGRSGYYPGYETRHSRCLYKFIRNGEKPEAAWAFALPFVCKQTYNELWGEIYQRNTFSFRHEDYLHAFATKISAKHVSLIRELRLAVYMGSARGGLFHQHPAKSLAVCRAFSGVRRLHASMELAFWKMPQMREALKTDWKMSHWARGLLNFGYLPLEHVSVFVHDCVTNHCRGERPSTIQKHFLDDPERRTWAAALRDQLLAPWDREGVLTTLHAHQRQEEQYHKKLCYGRVGFFGESCPLSSPEERIP